MKLERSPLIGTLAYVLTLFALAMLLAACATNSAGPTEAARNPKPPQLSEPLPSESYLDSAQKLLQQWRDALTSM
jgi:PBP1b-binding outer membrane lipoprotein LpoB